MIYIIRHAERADDGSKKERQTVQLDYDPQLTQHGHYQSKLTGQHLNQLFQSYQGLFFVTSPFLRCIQTSLEIIKQLDKPLLHDTLYVSYGLGEYYKDNWFTRDVLSHIQIQSYCECANCKYKGQLNTDINMKEVPWDQIRQQYPETTPEFFGRYAENYKSLKQYYIHNLIHKNYALVLITHGFGIHALYTFEKVFNFAEHVNYCSINAFKLEQQENKKYKSKVIIRNSTDHCLQTKL